MGAHIPSSYDLYLFNEGNHHHSYQMLGAHPFEQNEVKGVRFAVWAPHALEVRVVGDFNSWRGHNHVMNKANAAGVWSLWVPGLQAGQLYKYEICKIDGDIVLKSDPFAFFSEVRSGTASVIQPLAGYQWQDKRWRQDKTAESSYSKPMLIYEVHLGTWKRKSNGEFYTYRELAHELVDYVVEMGYTHVELLPLAEHPLDRSWGYQITGYYSVSSRYGNPHDFMYFVDSCHQKGIGVILDWVPGHFCKDAHGLREFDGAHLFEYSDSGRAEKYEWGSLGFDLNKPEVISFLISNAVFWLDVYHIDGLRVDAVSSLLYLDYTKDYWDPNRRRENLEAVEFLQKLNCAVFKYFPEALMIAEESTAWPLVSAPTYLGGLGFNYKWNMGWMNDTLRYMQLDPNERKHQNGLLTFSFHYAFSENYVLAFSHDEVVYGKKSLLNKMPGEYWEKFANLRVLFGYMMTHPGKKLLFMGGEYGQFDEWKDDAQLDWDMLEYEMHRKFCHFVCRLNHFYRREKAFWELDHDQSGFQWLDPHDAGQSVITYMRKGKHPDDLLLTICNFSRVDFLEYRIGLSRPGIYFEAFNSDLKEYGGSGRSNLVELETTKYRWHNQPFSISIALPALAFIVLKPSDSLVNKR